MKTTIPPTLFVIIILLTAGIAASVDLVQDAEALKSKGTKVQKYGSATKNLVCGDKLCSELEEKAEEEVKPKEEAKEVKPKERAKEVGAEVEAEVEKEATEKPQNEWKTSSGTITSSQDPGVGHETHQLAIILPPTSNVYKGILSYDASEPIQLVALHGPLGPGESSGQPIWTPDGKIKFALTLVDPQTSMGSWVFTGNALAIHTLHTDQFTVSYSVSYMEKEQSSNILSGTIDSSQDPGIGHEFHQLATILPPSSDIYHGVLTYSASEPIQLVALHGPLGPDDDAGQAIWTTDGKTKYGLTLVDKGDAMGTWVFAGNALAVHTFNEDQFTVSYSVVAGQ